MTEAEQASQATGRLAWMDLEMTGLNPDKDTILEIAVLITDSDLNLIAEGPEIAIHQSPERLAVMDEWNVTHHSASGLLGRVNNSEIELEQAEHQVLEFVSQHLKQGDSPLCGNSIWQDRRFLAKHMPKLEAFFHYRLIDVSTIKELSKRWFPGSPIPQKKESHRALADIHESLQELKYYREHLFIRGT